MADVKISGLMAVSAVEANDLLEVSEDTGGGTYASRKATATQVRDYVLGANPFVVPSLVDFGTAAFVDADILTGVFASTQNASYQVVVHDRGRLILCTSGTQTWTLPAAASVPDGWFVRLKNRSGNTLTVNRSGSDTIDAAATSLSIADGARAMIVKTGASTWESY